MPNSVSRPTLTHRRLNSTNKLIANAFFVIAAILCVQSAVAQGNYEIQVYGADTVAPKTLMVELHSNYTASGQTKTIDGVYPTYHQEHETLELTAGINKWAEIGFTYLRASRMDMDFSGLETISDRV
jgi:hypothetical protein